MSFSKRNLTGLGFANHQVRAAGRPGHEMYPIMQAAAILLEDKEGDEGEAAEAPPEGSSPPIEPEPDLRYLADHQRTFRDRLVQLDFSDEIAAPHIARVRACLGHAKPRNPATMFGDN